MLNLRILGLKVHGLLHKAHLITCLAATTSITKSNGTIDVSGDSGGSGTISYSEEKSSIGVQLNLTIQYKTKTTPL
jgi:hypothetical protein